MRTIARLLILLWIANDMRRKKKKRKHKKKLRMKRAAIRRKRRMERRKNGQFKIVLKESDKKALKRALPFIAVGSALWLMLTAGGAHKKTARAISMLK